MTEDGQELERRLRRLEDLEEIRQLFVDYGHLLDRGDFAGYASLFARDGELMLGPIGRAKGRDEIQAMMSRIGSSGGSLHLITSPRISLEGDRATSHVMWTVINRNSENSPVVAMIGHHEDELVREDGRWRFQRRRGFVEIPSALQK